MPTFSRRPRSAILRVGGKLKLKLKNIDLAIEEVSSMRSDLGAATGRLEHVIDNLLVAQENLTASDSRIRDTDMALEMVKMTSSQILSEAGTAMLAQANVMPRTVAQLLQQ